MHDQYLVLTDFVYQIHFPLKTGNVCVSPHTLTCFLCFRNEKARYSDEASEYRAFLFIAYQANNPTNAAVNNDTKIPDNNIIGTYLDTKSDVFLSTIPFNVPIIIPIVEKFANDTKNVEITALPKS